MLSATVKLDEKARAGCALTIGGGSTVTGRGATGDVDGESEQPDEESIFKLIRNVIDLLSGEGWFDSVGKILLNS